MMKLSTMLKIDNTIDTYGRSQIAERILSFWEHDSESARFFRASANFVYVFRKAGERYILRFTEQTERTTTAIQAELALLRFLDSTGMKVTLPVMSKAGRWLETVETHLGTFRAIVFTYMPGTQADIAELHPTQFARWGATLGQLHARTHLYQVSTAPARLDYKDHLAMLQNTLSKEDSRIQAEYGYLASFVSTLPVTATNYGLIHGDFELDNLFWQDESLAIIDFDDSFSSWYIADIAFALRDLFESGVDLSHPSFHTFLRGYSEEYALDEKLLPHLPTFMRLVKLNEYAQLLRSMDLTPDQGHPEWCNSLLLKLEDKRQNYKASLLSRPV